ncbi:unnamed protein product, partial [Arabidopsis halleri]
DNKQKFPLRGKQKLKGNCNFFEIEIYKIPIHEELSRRNFSLLFFDSTNFLWKKKP